MHLKALGSRKSNLSPCQVPPDFCRNDALFTDKKNTEKTVYLYYTIEKSRRDKYIPYVIYTVGQSTWRRNVLSFATLAESFD